MTLLRRFGPPLDTPIPVQVIQVTKQFDKWLPVTDEVAKFSSADYRCGFQPRGLDRTVAIVFIGSKAT